MGLREANRKFIKRQHAMCSLASVIRLLTIFNILNKADYFDIINPNVTWNKQDAFLFRNSHLILKS